MKSFLELARNQLVAQHDAKSDVEHSSQHAFRPGASSQEIDAAEARIGFTLTEDLKQLFEAANGIDFWRRGDCPSRFLPCHELNRVHLLMETEEEGPQGLVAILEAQGGNFVAVDLDPRSASYSRLIDCSHETFPYELSGICDSVEELLTMILESDGEDWLWPAVLAYGVDFAED